MGFLWSKTSKRISGGHIAYTRSCSKCGNPIYVRLSRINNHRGHCNNHGVRNKLKDLENQLTKYKQAFEKIYDEGLGFYGDVNSWQPVDTYDGNSNICETDNETADEPQAVCSMKGTWVGGKKARELQVQLKELRGE